MKKQDYIQPTMRVVVIKRRCHLLAGSNKSVNSLSSDDTFTWDNDGLDGDDVDM